jgi:hypothetical protein
MDIDVLAMSISALAVAISVYVDIPAAEKSSKEIKHTPRDLLPAELRKLIENVDELELIAKSS